MTEPNIVVFGYDELLPASLDFFSRTGTRVAAVVVPSNRTDWRALEIRRQVAERGFSILEQPLRGKISEFANALRRLEPDLIYAWSYPMILPAALLEIPRLGCVNVHMGLLPEYRGVNGVRRALLNGEEKTGVTLHLMDSGIDTGAIIARVSFPIAAEDDILSLMKKSKSAGLYLLDNCWPRIAAGQAAAVPQDESKARYYPAEKSPAESIDWSRSNIEIHNRIRASAIPFPGVFTFWNGRKFVLRKSFPTENADRSAAPGRVEKIDDGGLEIATGSGNLLITRIEFEDDVVPAAKLVDFGMGVGSRFDSRDELQPPPEAFRKAGDSA